MDSRAAGGVGRALAASARMAQGADRGRSPLMSHKAINWVINDIEFPKEVKPPARWLLTQIADRADKDTWDCYPSHKTMAADSGMSKRTVIDLLFVLESAGLIHREPQFRADGNRSTDRIILLHTSAIVAPGAGCSIQLDQAQHSTPDRANAAQQNLVTEPGNLTSVGLVTREPFEIWWDAYPRKVAKVAARKAWRAVPAKIGLADLLERTRLFADYVVGKDPQYIAHPASWLNDERWLDVLQPRSQTDGHIPARSGPTDFAAERADARVQAMVDGARQALVDRRRRWGF